MDTTTTTSSHEAKRLEALAWIEEAHELLGQAHAGLRDLGLTRERFDNAQHSGHVVSIQQALDDVGQLANGVGSLRFCGAARCGETADSQCENCDAWFCEDHGSRGRDRRVQDVGLVYYPACCDACKDGR